MASFRFTLFLSLVTLLGMCARIDAAFTCTAPWQFHDGNCYRVFSESKTWQEAADSCQTIGSHLVSIHSESENTEVYNVFSSFSPGTADRMWIGLNKQAEATDYAWSDGSTNDYSNWATGLGEPNSVPGHAAVVMIPSGNGAESSKWEVTTAISSQDYFMCKKPAQNTP